MTNYPTLPGVDSRPIIRELPLQTALSDICTLMKEYIPASVIHTPRATFSESHSYSYMPCYYPYPKRREKRESGFYFVVGLLSSAVALGAAYCIGKDLGARKNLLAARDLVQRHSIKTLDIQHSEYDQLLRDTERFFQDRNSEAMCRLAAKVALFVGASLALTGCLILSPVLVGVGAALAFVATCGWLVEKGFEESTQLQAKEAARIFNASQTLLDRISLRASRCA